MAFALVFPSNGDAPASTSVTFRFTGANMPDIQPLTLIWRVKPRQQTGFYTTFFHGRGDGSFIAEQNYFGCHPFPQGSPGANGTVHNWEVSIEGQDDIVDANANSTVVTKNQWYTQAAVCRADGAGQSIVDFYWDLLASTSRVISHTTVSGVLSNAPTPALTFGDAPWDIGLERLSASFGELKIFNAQLTLAELSSEARNLTAIVTPTGVLNRWWFKPGYADVDDLTDPVTGKVAAWFDASNKATLGELPIAVLPNAASRISAPNARRG